ncbi:hypothetical protein FH972_026867 [Carpinus fangiana]|uniref:Uncharacterized protein n=1 Tax=Carpinus fangiana TaxID=176857 RepID=A0A5N6L590_9ROSI|nr:hypothetical protein FH972_026867 [Carpinus fangiana]
MKTRTKTRRSAATHCKTRKKTMPATYGFMTRLRSVSGVVEPVWRPPGLRRCKNERWARGREGGQWHVATRQVAARVIQPRLGLAGGGRDYWKINAGRAGALSLKSLSSCVQARSQQLRYAVSQLTFSAANRLCSSPYRDVHHPQEGYGCWKQSRTSAKLSKRVVPLSRDLHIRVKVSLALKWHRNRLASMSRMGLSRATLARRAGECVSSDSPRALVLTPQGLGLWAFHCHIEINAPGCDTFIPSRPACKPELRSHAQPTAVVLCVFYVLQTFADECREAACRIVSRLRWCERLMDMPAHMVAAAVPLPQLSVALHRLNHGAYVHVHFFVVTDSVYQRNFCISF